METIEIPVQYLLDIIKINYENALSLHEIGLANTAEFHEGKARAYENLLRDFRKS